MKRFRRIIFYSFLVSTTIIIAFAFWFFSGSPDRHQIAGAFPMDSYEVFSKGENLTLYSLNPKEKGVDTETFQGFSIAEKTEIKDKSFQDFLKRSFIKSLSDKKPECFNPQKGIRIADGNRKLDIAISFECSSFRVYFKGREQEYSVTKDVEILFSGVKKDTGE